MEVSQPARDEGAANPGATARGEYARLFVVHAAQDLSFVLGFLLPALGLPPGEVLLSSGLHLGAPVVTEIERGVQSPVTVVVMSPGFLTSPWAQFAERLAQHRVIEGQDLGASVVVPALLADCDLPLLTRARVPLDFRDREQWEGEAAKLRTLLGAPSVAAVRPLCPYPGMRPFTAANAEQFRGRAREVADLVARVRRGEREIYVIGPSGSGKSSLIAAGLVTYVERSPDIVGWSLLVRALRPGPDPVAAVAAALGATTEQLITGDLAGLVDQLLAAHLNHDRVMLVVDQLEEVFTIAPDEPRAAFFDLVQRLRSDPRIVLLLAMRADFYGALMDCPLWADLDGRLSRLDVGPLRGPALREAIEAPARAMGVYLEPALLERLLADAGSEPGALPLLQETLVLLWARLSRNLLRLIDYDAMGDEVHAGLAVTVARVADASLRALVPARQRIARRLLLRLVQFGDGRTDTRRQQPRRALAAIDDDPREVDAVIQHLADHRLLTTDSDSNPAARIDLSHEVLLAAWPTLRAWIDERRADELQRRRLEQRASEWVDRAQVAVALLDAVELTTVDRWLLTPAAQELGHSDEVHRFVAASRAELARRRRQRRWRTAGAILGVACTCALAAAAILAIIHDRTRASKAESRASEAEIARELMAAAAACQCAIVHVDVPRNGRVVSIAESDFIPASEDANQLSRQEADDDRLSRQGYDDPPNTIQRGDWAGDRATDDDGDNKQASVTTLYGKVLLPHGHYDISYAVGDESFTYTAYSLGSGDDQTVTLPSPPPALEGFTFVAGGACGHSGSAVEPFLLANSDSAEEADWFSAAEHAVDTGARLPTQDELVCAHRHGILPASSGYWRWTETVQDVSYKDAAAARAAGLPTGLARVVWHDIALGRPDGLALYRTARSPGLNVTARMIDAAGYAHSLLIEEWRRHPSSYILLTGRGCMVSPVVSALIKRGVPVERILVLVNDEDPLQSHTEATSDALDQTGMNSKSETDNIVAASVGLPSHSRYLAGSIVAAAYESCRRLTVTTETHIEEQGPVEFRPGTATLYPSSFQILASIAETMIGNPDILLLEVQGHVHDGPTEARADLSHKRARVTVAVLVGMGVEPRRLVAAGYSDTQPITCGVALTSLVLQVSRVSDLRSSPLWNESLEEDYLIGALRRRCGVNSRMEFVILRREGDVGHHGQGEAEP